MTTTDSQMEVEVEEIYSETEGSSYSDSDSDVVESDPDYDILEETCGKFSNLSIEKKAKARVVQGESRRMETDAEELEMSDSGLDEKDEKILEKVQKIIDAGELEKLKVLECKLYLRKNGLRLTGNKDTLIQRIREHLEIINGGGETKYPPSSFVLNCKGDACTGDVVLFEQNVYEMFNIASRSASGPPCGKRMVAGRIVKESYGAAKQQHTFTIEVLWSKGEKPLPPLHPLLIKGRNLYRLKTLRQRWDDEGKRQKILMEKHSRGDVARANREARKQQKEERKTIRENRVSKKESSNNQSQSHPLMTKSKYHQHKKSAISINEAKPEIFRDHGEIFATRPHQQMIMHNHHHSLKRSENCQIPYDIHHTRGAEFSGHYYYHNIHPREKGITETTNRFAIAAEWTYRKPLTSANHLFPLTLNRESHKQKKLCRYHAQGRCHFGDNCKFLHDFREQLRH